MKRFAIFKPGKHTASSGATLEFTESDLQRAVKVYDPKVSEAPIVVGHPKDNHPAYGWVSALAFGEGGDLEADPIQVDPAFAEMVQAGRFKKRSASWYMPGSPNHPLKGTPDHDTYYLRHVGFLGAQPPAIKGLREVQFSDAEEGVVEFSDSRMIASMVARMMRNLREWIIGEKGVDEADKIAPDYLIADLEAEARRDDEPPTAALAPLFSEGTPTMKTAAELQAELDQARARITALEANQKPANFAELETSIAAREAAVAEAEQRQARAGVETRVDAVIKAGRLLPAQRTHAINFAMGLAAAEAVIDFGEGDKAKKVTQREAYLLQLEAAPKVVDYTEHSARGATPPSDAEDPNEIANKARAKVDEAAKEGRVISFTEAVSLVTETPAA